MFESLQEERGFAELHQNLYEYFVCVAALVHLDSVLHPSRRRACVSRFFFSPRLPLIDRRRPLAV
jgi:hypothetical protein